MEFSRAQMQQLPQKTECFTSQFTSTTYTTSDIKAMHFIIYSFKTFAELLL